MLDVIVDLVDIMKGLILTIPIIDYVPKNPGHSIFVFKTQEFIFQIL